MQNKYIKTIFLIAFFIVPAYVLATHGEALLGGMYIGAMSILIMAEKSKKIREILERIF